MKQWCPRCRMDRLPSHVCDEDWTVLDDSNEYVSYRMAELTLLVQTIDQEHTRTHYELETNVYTVFLYTMKTIVWMNM